MAGLGGDVDGMLGIVDQKRCHNFDTFLEYHCAVVEKSRHSNERNIVEDEQFGLVSLANHERQRESGIASNVRYLRARVCSRFVTER